MEKENSRKLTWKEKYLICLKEQLTIIDIMKLRDVSSEKAVEIRKQAMDYLKETNNSDSFVKPKTKVDTLAVFAVTEHNEDYYLKKMMAERKALV